MSNKKVPDEFVPLFVKYRRDRAIRAVGNDGELMFLRSLAHSRDERTDGFIEDYDLADLGAGMADPEAVAASLVKHGLWVKHSNGWAIRSWAKWNPGGASEAGTWGNHVRWHVRRGVVEESCGHCQTGQTIAPDSGAIPPDIAPDIAPESDPVIANVAELELTQVAVEVEKNSPSAIASNRRQRTKTDPDDDPRPEVVELCDHLADRVRTNGHTAKVGKLWHRACRLLIDVDGRTPDQIRAAIDWATADAFWSANIRSMQTLREKYTTLQARAQQRTGVTQSRNGIDWNAKLAAAIESERVAL